MTISVSKNMLLAKLQQLSRIIPSKSTTPIVCNYLFEIKDGRLFITTANDEGRITASLEYDLYSGSIGLFMPANANAQADENYFEEQLKRKNKKKKQRKIRF